MRITKAEGDASENPRSMEEGKMDIISIKPGK
jgi:hypothetical protein